MAEYVTYQDTNGVTWRIITTEHNMMATVMDDAEPRYIPPATDQSVIVTSQGGESRIEVERNAFQRLRELIDTWATEHRDAIGLSVKASPTPWGVLVLIGLALFWPAKRGRRR